MNIKEHGPGRIGIIGHVNAALGQVPDQPGVHGAKKELSPLCPFPGSLHVIQDPRDLAPGEISVGNEAGALPYLLLPAVRLQLLNPVRGPAALPDNGIVHRLPGILIPDNGRLPLVGDANSRDIAVVGANLSHGFHGHRQL